MELNIFMKELESALKARGIPEETAVKHVANLRRTFTSDDLSEIEAITSRAEINELADSISVILNKNRRTVQPKTSDARMSVSDVTERSVQSRKPIPEMTSYESRPAPKKEPARIDDDYFGEYSNESKATPKGMAIFWIGFILTLPITILLLLALFGVFISIFAALIALIIGGIAALVALVAAGTGVSLIGIIFGITQLFSFPAAGIYEIGLGIMVAGAVLFFGVLLYNFAVRFLPWIISLVGTLLGFICGKLKVLFYYVRRECYKL